MEENKFNTSVEDKSKHEQQAGSKLVVKLNLLTNECDNNEENVDMSEQDRDLQVSKESLLEQVKIVQKELERRKQHTQRIEELNRAVEEWKADFAKALEKIQDTLAFVE